MLRKFLLTSKAIADETRIRILKLLEQKELCVCELIEIIGLNQSTISKHLGILRTAGLVEARRDGLRVFYRLAPSESYALRFLELLKDSLNDDQKIKEDAAKLRQVIECS